MYAVISSGAAEYDVVFPSDYMVGKMRKEGMLEKINFENVPNFQYIDSTLKNPNYDPTNEYSVPYTWGTVGIFYNTKKVEAADLALGWDLLWCDKYKGKIFMFDNQRDAFGIALKKLGYSMNTTVEAEWQAAYDELLRQKPLLNQYVMDQVYDKMINEEGWIAPYYAGDGKIMMDPEEGNTAHRLLRAGGRNQSVRGRHVYPQGQPAQGGGGGLYQLPLPHRCGQGQCRVYRLFHPPDRGACPARPEVGENPNFYPPDSVLEKAEVSKPCRTTPTRLMDDLWLKLKK